MAKKEKKWHPSTVKAADLETINKVKEAREKQEISHRTLENKAGIAEGYISNAENPRLTAKYTLGHLNKIVKAINQTDKSHLSGKKSGKGKNKTLLNLHDLIPEKPVLSRKKVLKVINPSVKEIGPKNAILTLITTGFFDRRLVNLDEIEANCIRLFGKSFIRKSLSHRLNLLSDEGVLVRHKTGEPDTYHYKKNETEEPQSQE
ncbi:hypothetical protein SAMN05421820_105201 [Pedobacter steynii]|uniref:Uncharacterized protein n=1 Tax=Pedobacter steynii TaxID=430522 RepID=A0A1G9WLJ2_9SPHI|nr:helix-turn-helix transcriptional regulator [Pedobacter steynii]NQX40323.1 helix-turn-helix transcriptional regulator [Pedobacter steynii]SDM85026.1 hypothetical protein SAMN05421820_105201 [Pedobacter steynii]